MHTSGLPHHGLAHAPLWVIAAIILSALALAALQLLDGPDDIETARTVAQDAKAAPKAMAPNMAEAIKMACTAPHSVGGRPNAYGDIQCFDHNGRPSFYVHVWRPLP